MTDPAVTSAAMTGAAMSAPASSISAPALGAPLWRRSRAWLAIGLVVVAGGVIVAAQARPPGVPLDPASASKSGSLALARLLRARGTPVTRFDQLGDLPAGDTVLVTAADAYASSQLQALITAGDRLVLLAPSAKTVTALDDRITASSNTPDQPTDAGCADPRATSAGAVQFPANTVSYDGPGSCFGGQALFGDRVTVLGSADLLRNDELTGQAVAALDINALEIQPPRPVAWLMPGTDATGAGKPSIWSVFPDWTRRALAWLILLGALLVLWRGRRLGPVAWEPLPVVVRASETVQGHGRLYQRARASDQAAAALRQATLARLSGRLALPRTADASTVAMAAGRVLTSPAADVFAVLAGPAPSDASQLIELATELDRLETAVAAAGTANMGKDHR